MTAAPLVIFAGPTLRPPEARLELEALWLPPVAQGDVFGLVRYRPRAIAILDGYFERVPAVWHKEILWAMSHGIHVFGAASMGALRAAELHAFGMVGVGKIFEDFHSGTLQDDDEVAILHGPAEAGYLALSEAMVDIRATLAAARDGGVFGAAAHDELVALAKAEFYPARSYPRLLELAAAKPSLAGVLPALAAFLEAGKVSQKRADALGLMRRLEEIWPSLAEPKEVTYFFQATDAWMELQKQGQRAPPPPASPGGEPRGEPRCETVLDAAAHLPQAVLEELLLEGDPYRLARLYSRCRLLGQTAAEALRLVCPPEQAERVFAEHQAGVEARGEKLDDWLARQELTQGELARLLEKRAAGDQVAAGLEEMLAEALREDLKLAGRYGDLAAHCGRKWQLLGDYGWLAPTLEEAGLDEKELWSWHFARLGQEPAPDLAAYCRELGCTVKQLRAAALRDYLYRRAAPEAIRR